MELISLQQKTVQQILDLYHPSQKVVCEFKAPTGSGKTLMASYFISSLIERNPNDQFIFVVATPSSSSLPYFFEQKLNKYKTDLPYSRFEVEYIQSPSTAKTEKTESINKIIPEQNKVYIFGKSSFGKGRILSEYGIITDFVICAKDKGLKLIYIRDEAHIGGEKPNKDEDFENLMNTNATFVLKMTATPDYKNPSTQKVILKESDLNNRLLNEDKYLLKTTPQSLLNKSLQDTEVLEDAIKHFQQIKKEYANLNIGIHPAMLIQVDNDAPKDKIKSLAFHEGIANIKKTLDCHNIAWIQYFGNNDKDSNRVYKNKFTLDEITENNNDIDAIIFKIGPSTGWDIPRACMLIQLRNVSSTNLNIQTLGRIKRNPYPNLEYNDVTSKYYIYSNTQTENDEINEYHYKVREKFSNETFLSIDIENKGEIKNSKSNEQFTKKFTDWLNESENPFLQEIKRIFINDYKTYKKVLSTANGNQIYTTITNPFIFLRDYKRLITANKQLFDLINPLANTFLKKNHILKEFLMTVLLEKHKKDILNIISKTRTCKPRYKILEKPYDPQSYKEIYTHDQNKREITKKQYLFSINEEDKLNGNQQPLDSTPEMLAFQTIKDYTENEDGIKLWAKNLAFSSIFGEYLDDTLNVKKSYFDFILKFINGIYLYIEVKGIPDINAEKTELLKKAYEDYFKNRIDDLFPSNLVIAIWEVGQDNTIHSTVYYDTQGIKEDLNKLTADELLNKLGSMKI